jgi:hypothetical protein
MSLIWMTPAKKHFFGHKLRTTAAGDYQAQSKYVKFLQKIGVATKFPLPSQTTGLAAGATTATTQVLTWDAGDHTPTDYKVEYKTAAASVWSTFAHAPSTNTTQTVTGLTTGTSYNYRVSTVNKQGTGPASDVVTQATS